MFPPTEDVITAKDNGFTNQVRIKELITLIPLNVYSSESDDSDLEQNGPPDTDPGGFL